MKQYQRGQSSVEFVVLAFVLVPLIIIVPLLGKYIDLAQTTTVASRYVAFEGTEKKNRGQTTILPTNFLSFL